MSENKKHPHRATIDLLVDSDILPIPLTILWGQKVRNWAFEAIWFLKKATYQKSKKKLGSVDDGSVSSRNFV